MIRISTFIIAATLSLIGLLAESSHAAPKIRTYTVQPGDSIWSIANEFYGSGQKYQIIYNHNKFIGMAPYILKPGQVLTLPEGEVSPEAQVEWVRQEVRAKPPRSLDWIEASNKMNLWTRYQVSTGDESAVHIVFEDASDLNVGDNALLVIYGGTSKTAKRTGRVKTQVLLREGTVRGGLAALDGKVQPMEIETPSGTVDVNATDAQVQSDAGSTSVSVFEGEVDVKAGGTTVKVPKDHGTVVDKGKKPEAPRPLPPPPGWRIEGDGAAVAVVPVNGKAMFEAAWNAVATAKTYRVELAQDEKFKQPIVSVEVDASTTRFMLEQVPVGRYYARVSARDARKLQGRGSKVLQIDVVGVNSSRLMTQDAGRWEVQGFAKLDLGTLGSGLEWALDAGAFGSGSEPQRVIGEGAHKLRVRRVGQTVVTDFDFHVLAIRGVLDLGPKTRFDAGGEPRELTLTVTDEKGRPAAVPDVVIDTDPGGPLTLEPTGPGKWRAMLPAPAPPGPREILVHAAWPDGVLGRGYIEVERLLLESYVYRWPESTQSISYFGDGGGRLAATTLPSMVPVDRVGTETTFSDRAGDTAATLTLHGEAAFIDRALAIDGAISLFRLPLGADVAQGNELGDAVLGLRYVIEGGKRVTLAPSLRLRLPLGPMNHIGLGLEPSVLVRFRVLERLWFDTRQGVFAAFGSQGDTSYIGDYALVVMPLGVGGIWGLSAQFDTAVSFDDAPVALAFGVGTYLHLGRVRLGFELGFGIGDGGAARYGDINGGVTLDFGLGTP